MSRKNYTQPVYGGPESVIGEGVQKDMDAKVMGDLFGLIDPVPRKNYTPAERALQIIGALAGKTCAEINAAIAKGDTLKEVPESRCKDFPKSSFDMLERSYVPAIMPTADLDSDYWESLWEHCLHPKKVGDL